MLEKAKGDIERLNACNTLWTLAFDEENKKEINSNESAILELQKLLLSTNSELKRAAAGTLWECEGKQKHAEETQMSAAVQEATGRRGSRFLPPTSFTRCLFFPYSVGWGDEGPWERGCLSASTRSARKRNQTQEGWSFSCPKLSCNSGRFVE